MKLANTKKTELQNAIKTCVKTKANLTALLDENFKDFALVFIEENKGKSGIATTLANELAGFIFKNWYYKKSVLCFVEDTFESGDNQKTASQNAEKLGLTVQKVEFADGTEKTVVFKSNENRKANSEFKRLCGDCELFDKQHEPNGSNFLFSWAVSLYNSVASKENGAKGGNDEKGVNALQAAISKVNKKKADLTKDEILAILASVENLKKEIAPLLKSL